MIQFFCFFISGLIGCYIFEIFKNIQHKTVHHEHSTNFIIAFVVALIASNLYLIFQIFGVMVEAFNDSPLSPMYFVK